MQAAIDADSELSGLGLTVTKGDVFTAVVGIGDHKGETVQGNKIVISSDQGSLEGGNWIASNGLPPDQLHFGHIQRRRADHLPADPD